MSCTKIWTIQLGLICSPSTVKDCVKNKGNKNIGKIISNICGIFKQTCDTTKSETEMILMEALLDLK